MAPKKADVIENPPVGSSSEEDEESGSSGEESESSAGDSKKEESKLESDSEGESDSDSDPEPLKKDKQPVVASGSAVTLPESSSAKRPLKLAESEAKRLKISETEHGKKPATDEKAKKISGDDAKKMFQRLFSETDEIAMLQGIIDFTTTKGDPSEESDAFCIHLKKLIDFNATKVQIVTKLQRLKKKYLKMVKNALKKGKSEDEIVFAKDLDQKAFDLSRKIWGANGVITTKSRKKLGGTPMKEIKLKPHSSPKKQEEAKTSEKPEKRVVDTCLSNAREIASFFNAENASVCGLDESTITAGWENVAEGAKKTEMEEKWKKLKAKQVELCLQRTALVDETAKMIFKANAS